MRKAFKPLLLILLGFSSSVYGQHEPESARGTLFNWEQQIRWMILDQYSSYGGPEFGHGLFRHTTHSMQTEHDLDLFTYRFTPFEQYRWHYTENQRFRTYFGSLDLGLFAVNNEYRMEAQPSDRFSVPVHLQRTFDGRQDRALLYSGLNFHISENHQIGLHHTLTEHKADLDAILTYQFGTVQDGFISVDAGILDWTNRFIQQLSEHRDRDYTNRRVFNINPYYFSATVSTPVWRGFRAEVLGGVLTQTEAERGPLRRPQQRVLDRNRANYSGALIEYGNPTLTAGLTWQHTYNRFSRVSVSSEASNYVDYGNRQNQQTLGAYFALRYRNLHLQNWFSGSYFRDQRFDIVEREEDLYPFDFQEHRYYMKNRFIRNPSDRGFIAGVEWNADYRDIFDEFYVEEWNRYVAGYDYRRYYRYQVRPRNERVTIIIGYRLSSRTMFKTGFSIDIDGDLEKATGDTRDDPRRFDGGFFRIMAIW